MRTRQCLLGVLHVHACRLSSSRDVIMLKLEPGYTVAALLLLL